MLTGGESIESVAVSDYIILGLVIHLSMINESKRIIDVHPGWGTTKTTLSCFFVGLYSLLFTLSLGGESWNVDMVMLTKGSQYICIVSFIIGLAVFYVISNAEKNKEGSIVYD
ncbi:hypothetical protein [Enterovibrio baiacu]|uniref:hypothetical protein n=1 Tax=Enterovibrio baiacu TaxID=2491023 RepID=UPI001011F5B0|nr:hypothetical protein [Enterovibrio baiacu]MBE1273411.1 hypothetical protein [Enterovibrio baiacu]